MKKTRMQALERVQTKVHCDILQDRKDRTLLGVPGRSLKSVEVYGVRVWGPKGRQDETMDEGFHRCGAGSE